MKILFVDDDINILKSLKRSMLPTEYDIFTATDAESALVILSENMIDVIFSDLKMPNINGVDLLRIVKEKHPDTYRMILSGFTENKNLLSGVINSISLDYIAKPWNNEALLEKNKSVHNVRKIIYDPVFISKINEQIELPHIPEVYHEFQQAIQQGFSFQAIGEVIEKDITLATVILKLANNSFVTRSPILSIQTAIRLVGINGIKQFIMAASIIDDDTLEKWQINELEKLGSRASQTTKLFTILYNYCYNAVLKDEFSFLAFCIDLGRVILLKNRPEEYLKIQSKMWKTRETFVSCERKVLKDDGLSSKLGGFILNKWNFSRLCTESALFIHEPERSSSDCLAIIELLNIAYVNIIENPSMYDAISSGENLKSVSIFELPFSRKDIKKIDSLARKNQSVL